VVNTPEWHHWHHSTDPEARDKNFGLPVVDRIFGTAYLPQDRRPSGFGTEAPVPRTGYLQHLAYPFTSAAREPEGAPISTPRPDELVEVPA
jgi:sterol desaturase/sphingolipid hydroxylase (fatty acid hydroxylase superfamily)